jgi:predicted PurR-regulated permease PerM
VRVLRFCSPIGRYARAYLLVAAAVAVLVALVLWIGGVNANLAGV